MAKRPSVIGDLGLPPVPPAEPSPPAATRLAPGPKARPDIVHTSIYVPKPVHRKLREIAATTDRKVHDLIMEGVDDVLRRHGHPSIAELTGGGKAPSLER